MAHGLTLYSSTGALTFDSSRYGGVFVEFISFTQGTSGTKTYPAFTGRTLFAMVAYAGQINVATAWNSWTISHPSGVPTLTWNYPAASGGVPVNLILFVR
ncbi:hypothetical protein [Rhizobacter sp. Root1221]|uniref:hypothetical protein n=1 Tax=Rhizobacter sp. Root1221 TaxID=1736433 RepID=UPI000B2DACB5|nr:hypothetical protein [Rhizobacter sp. Root1221]